MKETIQNYEKGIYTAVIIEPREHKALAFVLNNFLENLDDRWNIIVFHGNKNKEHVENIINTSLEKYKDRISLIDLKVDNLGSSNEYSSVLLDKNFYDYIPTEIFLIFQTDTLICSKHKDMIYDFIDYDYVGAPIYTKKNEKNELYWAYKENIPENRTGEVGNGGLSLRKKSKMLEILNKCKITNDEQRKYEDLFFSFPCEDINGYKKPEYKISKNFSIENIINDKSFGLHKPWEIIDIDKEIKDWCPDVKKLYELNQT
jgi:hypothetical protein